MVRFIKRRIVEPFEYRAQDQKQRILDSHRVKRCDTCRFEVPEEDITVEDGREHCPMCVDTYTAEWLANEQRHVAEVQAESARRLNSPPQYSLRDLNESEPGIVTAITDTNGNTLSQNGVLPFPSPADGKSTGQLLIIRGVSNRTLRLIGQRFTAANVLTFPSGITSTTPVIAPSLITCLLSASVGMTPGSYGFTIADGVTQSGHEYPRLFAVR